MDTLPPVGARTVISSLKEYRIIPVAAFQKLMAALHDRKAVSIEGKRESILHRFLIYVPQNCNI